MNDTSRDARILVVDDQDSNTSLLEWILRDAGYRAVASINDPREVPRLLEEFRPDLILLDLHMPYVSGYDVLQHLRTRTETNGFLPVVVLTADITREARQRALTLGAMDFLIKPFDRVEVTLRVNNLLRTRFLHLALQDQNQTLDQLVRERTAELEESRFEGLDRLAIAAEYRDDMTGRHTRRVGEAAGLLAAALGLPHTQVELIRRAAPLHDVGKIGIPDVILLKPGKLTAEEFELMKTHTTIGMKILSGSRSPLLRLAEEIALTHHEYWNGAGYPRRLRAAEIPLAGRIVAVADAYDAMTSDRPYRAARPVEEASAILRTGAGVQWDAGVVDAFASVRTPVEDAMRALVQPDLPSRPGPPVLD